MQPGPWGYHPFAGYFLQANLSISGGPIGQPNSGTFYSLPYPNMSEVKVEEAGLVKKE